MTDGARAERVQKVLAAAGIGSRRACEELIAAGRVAVDGEVIALGAKADATAQVITVDGERIHSNPTLVYLLLNKPTGYVTTVNDPQGRPTVMDLIPASPRVYPVGRLDRDTEGLLLLTNDGELTNQLTHPRYGIPKTYRAMVDGFVQNGAVEELAQGVWLADPKTGKGFKTGRTHVRIVKRGRDKSQLEMTLREGRNRQVRRMLARLGHKVRDLTRIKMGPLTLKGLGPGEFRPLTSRELRELREMAQSRAKRHGERTRNGEHDEPEDAD